MKLKYLYIITFLISGLLMFSAFQNNDEPETKKSNNQIIKFSHSFHKDLAECSSCHAKAENSTSLKDRLMPNHEDCQSCHDTENSEQCNTCHYDDNFEPLIQDETELLFNHSFHIKDQKTNCETCHKGISDVDYSHQAVQPNPVMEDCYACHSDQKVATSNCEACHTNTAMLRPANHNSFSFMKTHKFASNEVDANCQMCHNNSNNSCETCHAGTNMITETNSSGSFFQPYTSNNFTDGTRQQTVTRVHDLNYRFYHGIDAKGKTSECQSCHEVENFCTSCHQADNKDYSMSGVVPASHLKPNFVTFGVGTGGGLHSDFAKKDIDDCVSCHDVQGADPTCITCHLDNDGVKGTNPKTHANGFMKNSEGDWHDNQGSLCFNCHNGSPAGVPGVGFCGYCHGSNIN